MLDERELIQLNQWCRSRKLSWQPARSEGGEAGLLLRERGERAWGGRLLLAEEDGFRLFDMFNNQLASAVDLPALLGTLDAGLDQDDARQATLC
jgi:hypothetical protein